jgi:hypothetical protein
MIFLILYLSSAIFTHVPSGFGPNFREMVDRCVRYILGDSSFRLGVNQVFCDVTQYYLAVTDVAGQPNGPIVKGVTLEVGTDGLYRNVGN